MRQLILFVGLLTGLYAQNVRLHPLAVFPVLEGGEGLAETVAWDHSTLSVFVSNARGSVSVIDLSTPARPRPRFTINVGGSVNSVAVKNQLVAIAVAASPITDPGYVAFYDLRGEALGKVTVGSLPDMLTFTPDGKMLLVANEGEESRGIDPQGTISLVDLAGGVAGATVRTVDFTSLDKRSDELKKNGLRVFPNKLPSVDLEPEYITVLPNGKEAWVCLQEANALARIDLKRGTLTGIYPLGLKDHGGVGFGLDPSDQDGGIRIAEWPVMGMYMPDTIAAARVGGEMYLFTANEGDTREEDVRVGKLDLDEKTFPKQRLIQEPEALGRLQVSGIDGDVDGDGDIDVLHSYGARSFSIWNMEGVRVFDSGDQFERRLAEQMSDLFNADNDATIKVDARSDNRGCEPEAVTVGKFGGKTYAFIGLERPGGIMLYDVSVPAKSTFLQYINDREHQRGPEDIKFISTEQSPTGKPLIVVANEMSGSIGIYELRSE